MSIGVGSERNLFVIGRRQHDEDQLTEMLVWLTEAVPRVGGALVRLAFSEEVDLNITDLTGSTQYGIAQGRLDALFVGAGFALVVESKLGSAYADSQIDRYLHWLASSHGHRERRALLTLTAREAPWSDRDKETAERLGVIASEHRWEELHTLLQPMAVERALDVSARLVAEFLEMLVAEGLVPVQPFRSDQLQTWRDAELAVTWFHKYFRACKGAIGEALNASVSANSFFEHAGYTWQEYILEGDSRVVVGLQASDEERVPKHVVRYAPLVWMGVEAKHWPDWTEAMDRLEASPPDAWTVSPSRLWGKRPLVWCYLDEIVGDGTFEQQRAQLAEACASGRTWLSSRQYDVPPEPVSEVDAPSTLMDSDSPAG